MKRYILLAGVNGAGKSTLYSTLPSMQYFKKINFDEKVREIGDWRDVGTGVKAFRLISKEMNDYFKQGISFTQETTLCGKNILQSIERAKKLGYHIEMHYVGLESVEIAKQRVSYRVSQGGHGIPEEDIERRYIESFKNLQKVLPQCDSFVLYDNTDKFRAVAILLEGKYEEILAQPPQWYNKIKDTVEAIVEKPSPASNLFLENQAIENVWMPMEEDGQRWRFEEL